MSLITVAQTAAWCSKRKFGGISLAISFAETFVVYGGVILVQESKQPHAPPIIVSVASTAWIVGGLGSLGFAVAGLVSDSLKMTASIAILLTIATFIVCGLQFLV